MVDHIIIHYYW